MFDNYRGVWTPHTLLVAKVQTKITKATNFPTSPSYANMGTGNITLLCDSPTNGNIIKNAGGLEITLPCRNIFNKEIDVGVIVTAQFNAHYNCFIVTGADCN